MALETGTYIYDLVPSNPPDTDLVQQGDDHLRLIKTVIHNTWPHITGPGLPVAGGTANALSVSHAFAPASYQVGQIVSFIPSATNTGPATISVNGLAAVAIARGGNPLGGGELLSGSIVMLMFDGTFFEIIGGSVGYLPLTGGVVSGELTVNGGIELDNTVASGTRLIVGQTSGLNRWQITPGDAATESGGNVGSNFIITRFNDAGSPIDTPLTITRSSGQVAISNLLFAGSAIPNTGGPGLECGGSGIVYAGYGGHSHAFNWTGSALQAWVDNGWLGNISLVSDYRAKRDVKPLPSMWEQVKALKPISYKHKDYGIIKEDDVERWGCVAHELQETLIEDAATGKKDEEHVTQSPNLMTVVAALTKALQEAMELIEALTKRVERLETRLTRR